MAFGDNISGGKNDKATGGGASNLEDTMEDKFQITAEPKAHIGLIIEGRDAHLIAGEIIDDLNTLYAKYDAVFVSGTTNVYWNTPEKKKEEKNGADHPSKPGNGKDRK